MSIIGKKLFKLLHRPSKRKRDGEVITSFEKATHLAILYTWVDPEKESVLEGFIERVGAGRQVDVLCFNPTKKPVSSQYPVLETTDISISGRLNSAVAKEFLDKSFDFIFHFDFDLNEITKSILVMTKAKCRVGFYSETRTKYYELMIGMNKNTGIANFAGQMEKYVKEIR